MLRWGEDAFEVEFEVDLGDGIGDFLEQGEELGVCVGCHVIVFNET